MSETLDIPSFLRPEGHMRDLFADASTGALFSDCRTWRYRLWRRWSDKPACMFLMLNPSTADEKKNDPTIARCQRWAYAWGYGALEVCNLFAFRATDPADMKAAPDPVGPDNNYHTLVAASTAGLIVCAWGAHGGHQGRAARMLDLLRKFDLHALAFTQDGQPRHPLYLKGNSKPILWKLKGPA